jgi:hypothetical protein
MSVPDLQREIKELKIQLQKEKEEREKLARYIQENVKPLEEREHANAAKIAQITAWIRDNLGPNLEHVKKLISESNFPADSSKDTFRANLFENTKGNQFIVSLVAHRISSPTQPSSTPIFNHICKILPSNSSNINFKSFFFQKSGLLRRSQKNREYSKTSRYQTKTRI